MGIRSSQLRAAVVLFSAGSVALAFALAASGCSSTQEAGSEISEYVFAASDYIYSPIEAENDDGLSYDEIVSKCMKELGFKYNPNPPLSYSESFDESTAASQFDIPSADTRGYGVVYDFAEFGIAEDSPFEIEESSKEDEAGFRSQTEADAYTTALYGAYADDLAADPEAEWHWNRAGCIGQAEHELVANPRPDFAVNPYKQLMDEVLSLSENVLEGREWQDAVRSWTECMAHVGYSGFAQIDDARFSIEQARDALIGSTAISYGNTSDTVEVTEENDGVPDRRDWDELRKLEIATAKADLKCRGESQLDEKYTQAYEDLSNTFVEENRAQLDLMIAWVSDN